MADVVNYKEFIKSQFQDEEKWALNRKLLLAGGLFLFSIKFMRSYGELLAI